MPASRARDLRQRNRFEPRNSNIRLACGGQGKFETDARGPDGLQVAGAPSSAEFVTTAFWPAELHDSPTAVDGIVSRARLAEIDARFFTKRRDGA
jgi:hypothetical protein